MSNELCHYGVPGMKWGVRRHRSVPSQQTTGQSKGDAQSSHSKRLSRMSSNNKAVRKAAAIGARIALHALMAYGMYKMISTPVKQTVEDPFAFKKNARGKILLTPEQVDLYTDLGFINPQARIGVKS